MLELEKHREKIFLFIILSVAFSLRCYHLTFQSLWLDELYTMFACDPKHTWGELFKYLAHEDVQPPLHHFLEKILFQVLGYTDFVARFLSVVAGTMSVGAIYFLGKEMHGKRLGFIVSILTTVNYFGIYYSQEARNYMLVFLFTIISFLFFIRFLKNLQWRNALYYSLFTVLMIYSHYFGLLVFVAQLIIAGILYLQEKDKRKFLKLLSISVCIICLVFAVWLPFMMGSFQIRSFWIPPTTPHFYIDFFYELFGNADLLNPFLLLFLILYFSFIFNTSDQDKKQIKHSPLLLGFVVYSIWIFVVFFIPYLRSILTVPMLNARYTIVALPAFLLMLSLGIESIKNAHAKYIVLTAFCILSLTHLFFVQEYYTKPHKTQFRELAAFIAEEKTMYPILTNESTALHQEYYMKKMNPGNRLLGYKDETDLGSRVNDKVIAGGFWIVGAHNEKKLSSEFTQKHFSSFELAEQKKFLDAWCELYVSKEAKKGELRVNHSYFDPASVFELEGQYVSAIWRGGITSKPILLKKGRYSITFSTKGTPLSSIYPHLNVFVDNEKLGDYYTTPSYRDAKKFDFEIENEKNISITIAMDNDGNDLMSKEDRNAFVKSIILKKLD